MVQLRVSDVDAQLLKTYLLASEARSLGIIDKIRSFCPDLLNENADTLKLGLARIPVTGVKKPLQLWTSVAIVKVSLIRPDQ